MVAQLDRPMLEGNIARPKHAPVAVRLATVGPVFRAEVAEQPHIKVFGRYRTKPEPRMILLAQRQIVRPHPRCAAVLEQSRAVRGIPALVTEFDGERQFNGPAAQKGPHGFLLVRTRMKRRRHLQQRAAETRTQFLGQMAHHGNLRVRVLEALLVTERFGQLRTKPETRSRHLTPVLDRLRRGQMVKTRIHFYRGEILRVKFQPAIARQRMRIKNVAPVVVTPRASSGEEPVRRESFGPHVNPPTREVCRDGATAHGSAGRRGLR